MTRKKMWRSAVSVLLVAGFLICRVTADEISIDEIERVRGSAAGSETMIETQTRNAAETAPEETRAGGEPEQRSVPEGEPESEPGSVPGSGPESESGSVPEGEPESERGSVSEGETESQQGAGSEDESGTEVESETETESPIDFEALWETNRDIYAWIRIPGTVIDYPILHSSGEDDFYLYHDIEGNQDIYGSIYTQQVNRRDFSDFHTILYGHNMKDDTMFGWLSEYQDLGVLWDHSVIYIYLPDRTLEYWIFAAYVADNLHQLGGVDTLSRESRQEYLDKVEERCRDVRTFDRRLFSKVTADSHILTLSTCYQNQPEHRFLVQAVLIEQPDPGTLPEMEGPRNRPVPGETEEAGSTEAESGMTEDGSAEAESGMTEDGSAKAESGMTEDGSAEAESGMTENGSAGVETAMAETAAGES